LKMTIEEGKVKIDQEGRERKFVDKVDQITFSGKYAAAKKQSVLYVTERCVFSLSGEGMELVEIAPGIDLEKDVLALMEFKPVIKVKPRLMDARIFKLEPMGIKDEILSIPVEDRLTYNPEENIFFVNFENFYVKSSDEIQKIKHLVEKMLKPLGRKVYTIVNYDNFNILPELVDEYTDMVKYVMQFYEKVTRYTTSTFLRMKLGEELQKRDVAPYIYESRVDAGKALLEKK